MRFLILLFWMTPGFAQDVQMVNPDTFCQIESFGPQTGKVCDSLKDAKESKVKSLYECKQRALTKGQECLKVSGQKSLTVTGKFVEKFSVSFNATHFTCGLSVGTGNTCP